MKLLPDGKGGEKSYFCNTSYRLLIGATQIQKLIRLGLKCERLIFNKSPQRDASQFTTVVSIERIENEQVVYCFNEPINHTGVFNGIMTGQCTEFVSDEDSDSCNLGSIYINRIKTKDDMVHATKYATAFLLCGGLYTDSPIEKCKDIRQRNNRIGLGIGGVSEWMVRHGGEYAVSEQLHKLLNIWKQESDSSAYMLAKELGVAIPKAKRAIAPNGTTSIIAGTTGGIEPVFCKAYKRRYYEDGKYRYQYVVDPIVKKLLDDDIPLSKIQDAYDISFKTRVKVQADIQQYVDMAISSTCNLPKWGDEKNNETTLPVYSDLLLKYAKRLRGFTCYPDASRKVQPLERCDVKEAMENEGKVFESIENSCGGSVCGI
jgi:ribonucleoside-diphosphate reductase alpha chain